MIRTFPSVQLPLLNSVDGFKPRETVSVECDGDPDGIWTDLPALGLAIVGTRYPQRRSFELLERVLRDLRGSGLIIVSGFARGIDSRAHELAVENGLRTVAVLGCGIENDYPRENRHLRRKIVEAGGMMVSHFPPQMQAFASNFLERNQLIAGFARATWVVEAAEVSGTLNTAMWATRMNRNLYATSCFPDDPFFRGNEKLLSQRHPDRYPVAEPLFGSHSLSTTWSVLGETASLELRSFGGAPLSRIQKWVLELETALGSCPIQTLMNHASAQGLTLGAFYREFEAELEAGRIVQDEDGRVSSGVATTIARRK